MAKTYEKVFKNILIAPSLTEEVILDIDAPVEKIKAYVDPGPATGTSLNYVVAFFIGDEQQVSYNRTSAQIDMYLFEMIPSKQANFGRVSVKITNNSLSQQVFTVTFVIKP